jgi:hypothetical protein
MVESFKKLLDTEKIVQRDFYIQVLIWSESWEYQDKFVGMKCKHKPIKIDVMDII